MNTTIKEMNRVNKIFLNHKYKEYLCKNEKLERERSLCKHNMIHFMDTARIMYMLALENGLVFKKDIIYACGLLHDIGRWQQYEEGTPHELASADLALEILEAAEYSHSEIKEILEAIKNHRKKHNIEDSLSDLLYKSDKLSRMCFQCEAQEQCNWDETKKNLILKY